ncbi:MAG: SMC family ATPase, partial [Pseudomonadota bacterium]
MRPLLLRLSAFGPFADAQTIDFESLGPSALFLIEGATGAGKTTLLDAICYALYDRSTGGEREARHMRSHFAPEHVLTEVELTFAIGSQRYRIRRVPEQTRPRQRGTGSARQMPTAELYRLDGDVEQVVVARKVGEANAEIAKLTGLTVEQFRQVMVLPQGQFRRLLTAESKERQDILQNLFGTALYSQVSERLKAVSSALAQQDREIGLKLEATWQAAGLSSESDMAALQLSAGERVASLRGLRQHAEAELQRAVQAFKDAEQLTAAHTAIQRIDAELADLESQKPAHSARERQLASLDAAEAMQPTWRALQSTKRDLAEKLTERGVHEQQSKHTAAELAEREQAFEAAHVAYQQRDALASAAQDAARLLAQWTALDDATRALQRAERDLSQRETAHTTAKRDLADGVQRIEEARRSLSVAELEAARVSGLQQQVAQQRRASELGAEKRTVEQQLEQSERQLEVAKVNLATARENTANATRLREQAERMWLDQHATALAASLRPGEPCPVCGSREHPAAASQQRGLLEPEAIDLDALRS